MVVVVLNSGLSLGLNVEQRQLYKIGDREANHEISDRRRKYKQGIDCDLEVYHRHDNGTGNIFP